MRVRDYMHDLRVRAGNGRVRVSNAWHRAVGRHVQGARGRFSNWRNNRDIQRGRRDIARRAGDQVRSRTPVVRGRINRATGRPHRDDRQMGRLSDQSLDRAKRERAYARYSERAGRLAPRFHPTGRSRGPTVQRSAGRWTR